MRRTRVMYASAGKTQRPNNVAVDTLCEAAVKPASATWTREMQELEVEF